MTSAAFNRDGTIYIEERGTFLGVDLTREPRYRLKSFHTRKYNFLVSKNYLANKDKILAVYGTYIADKASHTHIRVNT
jgi:hypothetical protein